MRKKTLSLTLISFLFLSAYIPIAWAHNAPFPSGYDPTHLVIDTVRDPESLDPAWAYDLASSEVISNVYETLISFKVEYKDGPYNAGKPTEFIPKLASTLPTVDYSTGKINPLTGLPYYCTWYFRIRSGVKFHPWAGHPEDILTPADVEYSFEREMIQDRDGGPQWMLFEPLLEEHFADPGPNGGVKIMNAVESNSTHVWFNLVASYPELAFKQILSQSWSSVVSKAWAVSRGDFDGDWTSSWAEIYTTWHNPAVSPLDSPNPNMVGTGPYKFSYWAGSYYSVIRHANYWGGWPAPCMSAVGGSGDTMTLGGYLEKVTWIVNPSWFSRRSSFLVGTTDMTYVPKQYRDQVLGQIVGREKIRCYYPFDMLELSAFFFTFDIATTSNYMGTPLPSGTFNTNGIPPDIFKDVNVRKGFAYAFNYARWINAMLNEGEQPSDPVIKGLAYDNTANNEHSYALDELPYSAEYYLKLAWGGSDPDNDGIVAPGDEGDLWNGGMKFNVVYTIGDAQEQISAEWLVADVNSLNPSKFFLASLGLDWGTQILPSMVSSQLPLFFMGFSADFGDPHGFVYPFMHSLGTFAQFQRYGNPVVDALIRAGIATSDDPGGEAAYDAVGRPLDGPDARTLMDNWREETDPQAYIDSPPDTRWPRRSIYYALQAYYYDDVPSIPLAQPIGRHWEQAWVRGWYWNSLHPGIYAYHLWKAQTHFGDISGSTYGIADGKVNGFDSAFVSAHWSSSVSVYGYHPVADINGGIGATTGGKVGPVRGMPDGKVDIVDLGLINAYWDNPPGASHP